MSLLRVNRQPSPRQLLVFALAWLVVLGGAGWGQWRQHRVLAAELCWALAVLMPMAGAGWREGLRLLYVGLSYATFPIGYLVSSLVLTLLYYGALTPLGLLLRVCGHDPLQRRPGPSATSYWRRRSGPRRPESYFRQH